MRNRDSAPPLPFRQLLLVPPGFPEPEAVIVLVGGNAPKKSILCRDKNEEREVWDGFRYGPDAARDAFGFDEAYSFSAV